MCIRDSLMAIYYASKAFVLSFSEALWEEARDTGVLVSCLCPGPTASKFRERAGTGKTRLSRVGTPMPSAEVAQQGYDGWRAQRDPGEPRAVPAATRGPRPREEHAEPGLNVGFLLSGRGPRAGNQRSG